MVAVLAGAGLGSWFLSAPADPLPVVNFTTALPPGGMGVILPLTFSHDGSKLVFPVGSTDQLYIRALDNPIATPIAGTISSFATFSPDDKWIAFNNGEKIQRVPVSGGAALPVYEGEVVGDPISWSEDDSIYFNAQDGSLQRVAATGGQPLHTRHRLPDIRA